LSKPAQQNDPRTRYPTSGFGSCTRAPPSPAPCGEGVSPSRPANNVPRRGMRQGTETKRCAPPGPSAGPRRQHGLPLYTKRLSATDISALASMKNVAKCDTWCELQNPVNHRVFERKLRPKPLGRGHVCLGVTRSVAPQRRAPSWRPGRFAVRIVVSRGHVPRLA
jgi:hypothetical protein